MTGSRYFDWTHVHVEGGDRAAAAPYIGEARKLLGAVFDEAGVNDLGVHALTRKLPDGTVLIAEKHGEIPRITVVPVPTQRRGRRRTVEGFTFTWGGFEEDRTPVLFLEPDPPDTEEPADWRSMFYNSDAVGYDDTPEDRRAGSYVDVFGTRAKEYGYRFLPGSGTWTDPESGEVVSWFRGYLGYWPQHYRHPRTNYSNAVSVFGHIVYAVPDAAWRVLAAAKRGGWLYVLVCEDLGAIQPAELPAVPSHSAQVWCSQPYADTAYTYSLRRYPLGVVTEPDTLVETYRADLEGEEALWTGQLEFAYGAWSFNADCSRCVTVQLPRIAAWCTVYEPVGPTWLPSSAQQDSYPEEGARRIAIELTHAEDGVTAELSESPAPALIAEDDDLALELHEVSYSTASSLVELRLDGFALPIAQASTTAGNRWYERRTLVHAHIPTRTLLLYRWRTEIEPVRYVSAGFELYVDGERVELTEPAAVESGYTASFVDQASAANFLRQLAISYDNGVGVSWRRPMDAITFLLGITFAAQGSGSTSGATGEPQFGYQTAPFVPMAFNDENNPEHSAAGGYVFGSMGGPPGAQVWGPNYTLARAYGANHGEYFDAAPSQNPTMGLHGTAVTQGENTMAVAGLQPMLGINMTGLPTALAALMNVMRTIRFGTHGDARTLFDALLGAGNNNWRGFNLGHTGSARKNQRGSFEAASTDGSL